MSRRKKQIIFTKDTEFYIKPFLKQEEYGKNFSTFSIISNNPLLDRFSTIISVDNKYQLKIWRKGNTVFDVSIVTNNSDDYITYNQLTKTKFKIQ